MFLNSEPLMVTYSALYSPRSSVSLSSSRTAPLMSKNFESMISMRSARVPFDAYRKLKEWFTSRFRTSQFSTISR